MKKGYRIAAAVLALLCLGLCAGSGRAETAAKEGVQDIIEEMVVDCGSYGEGGGSARARTAAETGSSGRGRSGPVGRILSLWKDLSAGPEIHYDVLPDGLPDTDELGIVALGFQLAPDGSMREELVERLQVLLRSAEKYPNAVLICTGGGTAAENGSVTEAGRMAEWLTEHGVAPERVIVEDRSLTTAQNAIFTFDILESRYPQVRKLAVVSSDYHIATGMLLFGAESVLRAEEAGGETLRVVSNAAWQAPSGSLSSMFQAGALIELSGDTDTAFEIYYDTYDIHELPPLKG